MENGVESRGEERRDGPSGIEKREEGERKEKERKRERERKRRGGGREDEQEGPLGIVRGRSLVTRDSCDPDDP